MNPRLILKRWLERAAEAITWPTDPIEPLKSAQLAKYLKLSAMDIRDIKFADRHVEVRHRLNSMGADVRILDPFTGELMTPKNIVHKTPDILWFDLPMPCAMGALVVSAAKYRGPTKIKMVSQD